MYTYLLHAQLNYHGVMYMSNNSYESVSSLTVVSSLPANLSSAFCLAQLLTLMHTKKELHV